MASFELNTVVGTLKENHVFHLELNRPKALNSLSNEFFTEFQTAFANIEKLKSTHDIRVVILTGRGKHFTAGIDLKSIPQNFNVKKLLFPEDLDVARRSIFIYNLVRNMQKSFNCLQECTVPVLVGIQGFCIGAGIDLICAADIRFCTEGSVFSIKEVDIGLAADIGTLQRIDDICPNKSLTRELIFTSRNFSGIEAKEIGLVSRVLKDEGTMEKELWELANLISTKSPVAVYTSKLILVRQSKRKMADDLDVMAMINASMLQSKDVQDSMRFTVFKEKGQFAKL